MDRWPSGFYFVLGGLHVGLIRYGGNWQLSISWIR